MRYIALLCLISFSSFSQDLLVLANKDTLRVYILRAFAKTNTYQLTYKIAPESNEEIVLKPEQVHSFFIGSQYVSLSVKKENFAEQLLLQEVLVNGKIKLYKGIDAYGYPAFFINKNEETIAVTAENLNTIIETYFTDCPNFNRERYLPAESKFYRQDYLMDLVSHYNHCVDETIPYYRYYEPEKSKKRDNIAWGAKIGAGIQEYAYRSFATDANAFLYGSATFPWRMSFIAGLYGSINYSKTFSVLAELSYMYRNAVSEDGIIELRYSGINMPLYLEFRFFNSKKVRPFINMGGNAVIAIRSKYTILPPPGFQLLKPIKLSPVSFGIMSSIGTYISTAYKPLKVEFRAYQDFFEASNPTFGDDKMKVSGIMLMLSYPL